MVLLICRVARQGERGPGTRSLTRLEFANVIVYASEHVARLIPN